MRIPRRETEEEAAVHMAPLIDCVFLLLIFFLVATTLKKLEPKIELELPHSAAAIEKPVESDLLVLTIDRYGQKYIGNAPVTTDVILRRIRAAAQENPNQRVRIDADVETRYKHLIEVIELCQFEGLRDVGLHTRKDPERTGY